MALAVLVLFLLIKRHRNKTFVPFIFALAISILWSFYFRYEYNGSNWFLIDRINIYPLILWTAGLTGLRVISYEIPGRSRLPLAIVFYLIFLITVEAVGYHLLNIRLIYNYTSLLNLGVIHAPLTMKIFYIFTGPVYLLLLDCFYKGHRLHTANK